MPSITIKKSKDGNSYTYVITDKENKKRYVSKKEYETQKMALEAARRACHKLVTSKEYPKQKPTRIKNLNVTNLGLNIASKAVYGLVALTIVVGGVKLSKEIKEKFPDMAKRDVTREDRIYRREIDINDCDFSNMYVILRSAKTETRGVSAVTSDMLTRLGVSNEIVDKDSNLASRINNVINENPDSRIVVINLETELENKDNNKTIIMGDSSNRREYPSDILISCIDTSLREYSFNSIICSGQRRSGGWRLESYLEQELIDASLSDRVSQLTIDLPIEVSEDEITRNDAASSIMEGIVRWGYLQPYERYTDIYYTAKYGDNIHNVSEQFGITGMSIEENSDINIYKGVTVGDALLVGIIPEAATPSMTVNNPYTTTNINDVEPVINTYVVQSGDTLTKIANMYGVKVDDIVTSSGNPNNIRIGETLYITTYNLYETHKKIDLLNDNSQNHI